MVEIIVVDDQNLVMAGICSLLELNPNFKVIAQISDSTLTLQTVTTLKPDILLLDIRMPKMDGLEVLQAIKDENINVPTMMLTTFDEHELVLKSLQLGAMGYLRKDVSLEVLNEAIIAVANGERWIQPAASQQLSSNANSSGDTALIEELTPGELQVLRLIASGFSNHEIGEALHKSSGRVRNIVSVILEKLSARDRTQAALKGLELGLI